ncbi:hypothetical protein Tco_0084981 [Tanacetum coccineum]
MCDNEEEDDHYADDHEDERVALANLNANLKLGTNENKKIQKHLRKPNATLTHELNECKSALEESNDIQDRCRSALHDREIELEKYKKFKNCQLEKEEVEHNRLNKPITNEITVLVKNLLMPLAIKTKANVNEFKRAFKQEMFEDIEYVQSLENEVDELESEQADFSNEYDLLLQEFVSKDIMSYFRMLYENTSKTWTWWIEKQCPSRYKWMPKTKKKWVPKIMTENVSSSISPTIDIASRITNVSTPTNDLGFNLSNVPSSSKSFAYRTNHPIHRRLSMNKAHNEKPQVAV